LWPLDNCPFVRWQRKAAYRSNNMQAHSRNAARWRSFEEYIPGWKRFMNQSKDKTIPPATQPAEPDREIELKVKKHPDDKDAKADLGSDESMDASDPSSATQPGSSEPAPSSGFPD
jgi:hypothetical protein